MRRNLLLGGICVLAACNVSQRDHAYSRKTSASCPAGIVSGIISGHRLSSNTPVGSSTVFLQISKTDGKEYACSGTLIDRQLVLTAQRCADDASTIAVIFSDVGLSSDGYLGGPQVIADTWAKYAASYATPHDLAVWHLAHPAPSSFKVRTLPASNFDISEATDFVAAGYGITTEGALMRAHCAQPRSQRAICSRVSHCPTEATISCIKSPAC